MGDELPDETNADKIEEGLYLGNLSAAMDANFLDTFSISHILTVDSKPLNGEIGFLRGKNIYYINVDDMHNENLLSHFPKAIEFIQQGQANGNVLVHCYFGVSRSATVVIAYLMIKYGLRFEEAHKRAGLATLADVVPHSAKYKPEWHNNSSIKVTNMCLQLFFIFPSAWIKSVNSTIEGKINCFRCESKLGSYNWQKSCKCHCGIEMAPHFTLIPSRVDFSRHDF